MPMKLPTYILRVENTESPKWENISIEAGFTDLNEGWYQIDTDLGKTLSEMTYLFTITEDAHGVVRQNSSMEEDPITATVALMLKQLSKRLSLGTYSPDDYPNWGFNVTATHGMVCIIPDTSSLITYRCLLYSAWTEDGNPNMSSNHEALAQGVIDIHHEMLLIVNEHLSKVKKVVKMKGWEVRSLDDLDESGGNPKNN